MVHAPSVTRADGPAELPAELLKRLEFKVLRRLDGYLFGDYTGIFYGPSLDLAEVREYQPGDEVRRIDWNVTARTGKVHVRQFREEREVLAWLVVDRSASMGFGTRRVLKRELALEFAAVAAAVVARKGKIGAFHFSEAGLRLTPPSAGRRQRARLIAELAAAGPSGTGAPAEAGRGLAAALQLAHRSMRRRALVFVVSDFLDGAARAAPGAAGAPTGGARGAGGAAGRSGATSATADASAGLPFEVDAAGAPSWERPLARLGLAHDVIAVRVSDPAERALPVAGELRVRDLESGQELWLDTRDPRVRGAYAELVANRDRGTLRALKRAQVDLLELSTERDVVEPILRFVMRRRGRRA